MKLYWIMKITSEKKPNECVFYWTGTTHRNPETYFKMKMKEKLKYYKENPINKNYKPYYAFAEDVRVEAKIASRTALSNHQELDKLCETLTTIYNSQPSNEYKMNVNQTIKV